MGVLIFHFSLVRKLEVARSQKSGRTIPSTKATARNLDRLVVRTLHSRSDTLVSAECKLAWNESERSLCKINARRSTRRARARGCRRISLHRRHGASTVATNCEHSRARRKRHVCNVHLQGLRVEAKFVVRRHDSRAHSVPARFRGPIIARWVSKCEVLGPPKAPRSPGLSRSRKRKSRSAIRKAAAGRWQGPRRLHKHRGILRRRSSLQGRKRGLGHLRLGRGPRTRVERRGGLWGRRATVLSCTSLPCA